MSLEEIFNSTFAELHAQGEVLNNIIQEREEKIKLAEKQKKGQQLKQALGIR